MIKLEKKELRDFSKLKDKLRVHRSHAPTSIDSFRGRSFRTYNPVRQEFSLQEIKDIIQNGDHQALRELSRYYFRTSGLYKNAILYLSNLNLFLSIS